MLLPINWLKKFVAVDINDKSLADGLTNSGSHVESINRLGQNISDIVVGKVLEITKHPNADKLLICKIDIGSEVLNIVTGAKNIREKDFIPVATVGATLADGTKIEVADFKGISSYGMLCSLSELGYQENVIPKEYKDGLLILNGEFDLGLDIKELLELNQSVIEFEITPNRPDCLSIYGMAREASATFRWDLKERAPIVKENSTAISSLINDIEINSENCNRYYARVLYDVKIDCSPLWLQAELMNAGVRPINNIVDITNYVMLEFGEPLHAFDLDKLNGKKVIVRQAKQNEEIQTLDESKRKLISTDLVIADETKPIALAGIMGGLETEISEKTNLVLLEGASFDAKAIRQASKRLALRTEASTRFEKGIDNKLCDLAVDRACELVELIGAGKVAKGFIDINNTSFEPKQVSLRPKRADLLLGKEISIEDMLLTLNHLGIESTVKDELIISKIPSFREDIKVEADLIEEIGRVYGYHNIESKPLITSVTRGTLPLKKQIELKVKGILQGAGYNEVMTYSFISPKAYDKLNLPQNAAERSYIRLLNPLGEDYSTMRTTLISNMLELLARNENRGIEEMLGFEIGNVFLPKALPVVELPNEKQLVSIGFYSKDKDFYYLKSTVELILNCLGIHDIKVKRINENPSFHPGRSAIIIVNEMELGIIGQIHPSVANNYGIENIPYIASLDFDLIVKLSNDTAKYIPLPKYPSVTRDIAVVVKEEVLVGDLEEIIIRNSEEIVEKVELFDVYRSEQLGAFKKSVAFSIVFRSYEGTLKDDRVNNIIEKILAQMSVEFDAKLRS